MAFRRKRPGRADVAGEAVSDRWREAEVETGGKIQLAPRREGDRRICSRVADIKAPPSIERPVTASCATAACREGLRCWLERARKPKQHLERAGGVWGRPECAKRGRRDEKWNFPLWPSFAFRKWLGNTEDVFARCFNSNPKLSLLWQMKFIFFSANDLIAT